MAGREDAAQYYLKKHKIPELLNNLTSCLVYERPDDPRSFMVDFLRRLNEAKSVEMDYPSLFDESNVRSLFGILDPSGKGYITHTQYKEAMGDLGVENFDRNPAGSDVDKITIDVFIAEANKGLSTASATFAS